LIICLATHIPSWDNYFLDRFGSAWRRQTPNVPT
jgi:hypothetical protein